MKRPACIGITLGNGVYHVDTQRSGQAEARVSFPTDERGTEMLKRYVSGMGGPVRLAIVLSRATIGIALALGEPPEREVFLVSATAAAATGSLASFAARPV